MNYELSAARSFAQGGSKKVLKKRSFLLIFTKKYEFFRIFTNFCAFLRPISKKLAHLMRKLAQMIEKSAHLCR